MEPRRLLEENPTDVERALLNAGTAYRCSPTGRAKTLAALGLAGTAAVSAVGLGVSGASLVAKFGWAKIVMVIAALGAVTAAPIGYYAWKHAHQLQGQPSSLTLSPNAAPQAPVVNEPQQRPPVTQPAASPADDANTKSPPTARVEPRAEGNTALSEELSALDAARAMLAHGDASGALVRLDNYNKAFPKGRLQLEAEVLRIDALMKSGQQEAAKRRAQSFLAKHPNSVLASRVRSLL